MRWVVGATLGAVATVVVAAFGAVVLLLTAWSPVEDEELDGEVDDGDDDTGGDRGDDDTEDGDSDG